MNLGFIEVFFFFFYRCKENAAKVKMYCGVSIKRCNMDIATILLQRSKKCCKKTLQNILQRFFGRSSGLMGW